MFNLKNISVQIITLTMLVITSVSTSAKAVSKKVVMVVSSYGQERGETKPGYEFDEFSKAYTVFKSNGISVDVASPTGGVVEADEYDPKKLYNATVLADTAIMEKLNNTIATAELDASAYDGIFIVGGKGAMFDLPKDESLKSLIANIYQKQGSVAAVCHGPAALVDVKLKDGSYLVANKAINGFTNQEEKLFGKKWINDFEFMLEDKLVERGGKFQSSDIMLSHVAVDERLITGQNPTSTTDVATELVKSMGLTPVAAKQEKEEKTLGLIAQFLDGEKSVIESLASNQTQYQMPLIGMYGYYYLNVAESDKQLENALALMSVAKEAINNPTLDMKIAATQHKLGRDHDAKKTLDQLLASKPDHQGALDMMKTLSL